MRTLLLMRGTPGSGKSTWIKENGLEQYTLEADRFRMLVSNPVLNEEGYFCISQKNDSIAWKMLFECLERRMENGEFTVVDATHSSSAMVNKYHKLAQKYRYRVYIKDVNIPLEELYKRNNARLEYKRVPENAIERIHALIENTNLPSWVKNINDISEIDDYFIDENVDKKYDRVLVIGDIHGCYTALNELVGEIDQKTLYVFCGDYLDRGIEEKDTVNFILEHKDDDNFIFIEGNHENRIREWLNDDWKIKKDGSKSIPKIWKKTVKDICDGLNEKELDKFKKDIYEWTRKLRAAYAFSFFGKKYFVCHAGIPSLPKMTYISAKQLIHGVGYYDTEIDEIWENSYNKGLCRDFTQIHGHRKTSPTDHSICLEGGVERGGELCAYSISKQGNKMFNVENKVYDKDLPEYNPVAKVNAIHTANETTNIIANSPNINVKEFDDMNLMSLNFNRKAFRKGIWDGITNKARGLFVDKTTGDIKIRSYNKFFNYGEREETSKKSLEKNLKFPCSVFRKENGFLGMMSVINGEVVLASKSVVHGDFVDMFKEIWDTVPDNQKSILKQLSEKNNCSFVFEVCHINDKHIIDFDKNHLYLLDAIPNSYELNGDNVDGEFSDKLLAEIPESEVLTKKTKVCEINSLEDLEVLVKKCKHDRFTEGYVVRDSNGFCFKVKLHYYNVIKKLRGDLNFAKSSYLEGIKWNRFNDGRTIKFIKYFADKPYDEWKDIHIIDALKEYEKVNGDFIANDFVD